jgi:hypothetical protein
MAKFRLGSVSTGTLRTEDLLTAFMDTLDELIEASTFEKGADAPDRVDRVGRVQARLGEIERRMQQEGYHETEEAQEDLEYVRTELESYAPPYVYFGAAEGDGSDFGFFIDHDQVDEAFNEGDLVRINAGDAFPEDPNVCEIVTVNDHENMTFYTRDGVTGDFEEVFSVA